MSNSTSARPSTQRAAKRIEVNRRDLPLHCPVDENHLWDTHPRVFLPIEDSGKATCPYCGCQYTLKG